MPVSASEDKYAGLKQNWGRIYYSDTYQSLPEERKNLVRLGFAKKHGVPQEVHHSFITGKFDDQFMQPSDTDVWQSEQQRIIAEEHDVDGDVYASTLNPQQVVSARRQRQIEDASIAGIGTAVKTSPNSSLAGIAWQKITGNKIVDDSDFDKAIGYEYQPEGFMQNLAHQAPAMLMDVPALKAFGVAGRGLTKVASKVPGKAVASTVDDAFSMAVGLPEQSLTRGESLARAIVKEHELAPAGVKMAKELTPLGKKIAGGTEFALYTGTREAFNPYINYEDEKLSESVGRILKASARGFVEGVALNTASGYFEKYLDNVVEANFDRLKRVASKKGMRGVERLTPDFEKIAKLNGEIDVAQYVMSRKNELTKELIKQRLRLAGIPYQGVVLNTAQAITHGDPSQIIDPNALGMNIAIGGVMHMTHSPLSKARALTKKPQTVRLFEEAVKNEMLWAKGIHDTNKALVEMSEAKSQREGIDEIRVKRLQENNTWNKVEQPMQRGFEPAEYLKEATDIYRNKTGYEIREVRSHVDKKIRWEVWKDGEPLKYDKRKQKGVEPATQVPAEKLQSWKRNLERMAEDAKKINTPEELEAYQKKMESGKKIQRFDTLEEAKEYVSKRKDMKLVLSPEEARFRTALINMEQDNLLYKNAKDTFFDAFRGQPEHLTELAWEAIAGENYKQGEKGSTKELKRSRGKFRMYEKTDGTAGTISTALPTTDAAIETLANATVKERPTGWSRHMLKWKNAPRELANAAGRQFSDLIFNMVRQTTHNYMLEQAAFQKGISNVGKKYSKAELRKVGRYFVGQQRLKEAIIVDGKVVKNEAGEIQYDIKETGIETLKRMGLEKAEYGQLTAKERELVSFINTQFEMFFDRYNAMRILAGKSPVQKSDTEADYFPMFRRFTMAEQMGFEPGALEYTEWTKPDWKPATFQANKHAIERIESYREVEIDPLIALSKYGNTLIRNIHNAPVLAKLNEFLGRTHQTSKGPFNLKQNEYAYDIVEHVRDKIAGFDSKGDKFMEAVMKKLSKNVVTSTLGFLPSTVLNQMGAIDGTLALTGPRHVLAGTAQSMNPEWVKFAMKNSSELKSRVVDVFFNTEGTTISPSEKSMIKKSIGKVVDVTDKWNKLAFKPMQWMDKASSTVSWLSSYDYLVNTAGWKPNDIATFRMADKMLIDIQGSGKTLDMAPIQTTGWGKFLTAFQTFTINRFNWLTSDIVAPIFGKGSPDVSRMEAMRTLIGYTVASAFVGAIYEGTGQVTGLPMHSPSPSIASAVMEYTKSEEKNKSIAQTGFSILLDQFRVVPMLGAVKYGGESVFGANLDFLIDAFQYISSLQGDIPDYQVKSLGYLMGKGLGIGGTQAIQSFVNMFNQNQKRLYEQAVMDAKANRNNYRGEINRFRAEIDREINKYRPGGRKPLGIDKKRDYPGAGDDDSIRHILRHPERMFYKQ